MGENCAVVLKNHGVAVCSDSIENACIATFSLEETAQLHWIAAQLEARAENFDRRSKERTDRCAQSGIFAHVWGHYAELDPWDGMNRPE